MRTIRWTGQFKKDYRRECKGRHAQTMRYDFLPVVERLAEDLPLEARLRDHALTGTWKDHRDCHIKPDLVLIYKKVDNDVLWLARLGSHSELEL